VIVQVIKKTGTRFEYTFPDDWTSDRVLAELESIKAIFGFNGTVRQPDKDHPFPGAKPVVDYGDPESGYAYDHPETVVAQVRKAANGDVVIVKQLKGPEPKAATEGG